MDISNNNNNTTVQGLENAMELLLNNNFDADSKVCIVTLMKMLDNVLKQPLNPKVRSIRINNPNFQKRVGSRKGGIEYLLACGFVQKTEQPGILQKVESSEMFLVLPENVNEDIISNSMVMTGRRLLQKTAVQDLRMKPDDIPQIPTPPAPVSVASGTTKNATTTTSSGGQFDVYQSKRYDGMSASVGMQCTPDSTYVSKTDQQLQLLQSKQQKLENQMQKPLVDRCWCITMPGGGSTNSAASAAVNAAFMPTTSGRNEPKDSTLLMEQFKKQQEQRKKQESGGFTTKNMRDLEKLKKQKVYSHVQLAIQFTNGIILHGKFLPKEKLQSVIDEIQTNCFNTQQRYTIQQLYVTPPKRMLNSSKTLQEEDLVPAAKIFVKIQPQIPSSTAGLPNTSFLNPQLVQQYQQQQQQTMATSSFPNAKAIVPEKNNSGGDGKAAAAAKSSKQPATKKDREEEMMRRMMGGGKKKGFNLFKKK